MPFYGKYRGKVAKNDDPLKLGRVMVVVPAIADTILNWAMPCTPYAGPKVGFYMIPPVGANVWVEFEGGDPNYPIWTGSYWGDNDLPPLATGPDVKIIQTEKMQAVFDDPKTEMTFKMETDSGVRSIIMNPDKIVLTAGSVTITITNDKIALVKAMCSVEVADDISLKKGAASIQIADSIAIKNGAATIEVKTAAIDVKNGAASVQLSPASVNINNGALEVI